MTCFFLFFFETDGSEYLLVYNRPKQYYGSLYEPDKQYVKRERKKVRISN